MIRFQGKVSEECLKYITRKETQCLGRFYVVLFLITSPIIIALAIKIHLILLLILAFFGFLIFYGYYPQKGTEDRAPLEVTIDEDVLTMTDKIHKVRRKISHISKVVDGGEWYDFHFKYRVSLYFICEKKLLTEGTIEEFETRFKDKLTKGASKKHGKEQ